MDRSIQQALKTERTIDITTIGRKTGQPRRVEIWFHNVDGRIFITGLPGKRSWYANMLATPNFTFHLKESVQADLPARALPIVDEADRCMILSAIIGKLETDRDLDEWVAASPLVEIEFRLEP
ncbi:MAG: nitroreductase family deazaflavin-dependent oxidoreductase [Chloroflexi bacterium]|nr:nitroreductase family deazaflavin-dependent oxidoreductase [Chloroflexota bacterium]